MSRLATVGFESQILSTTYNQHGESSLGTPDASGHACISSATCALSTSIKRSGEASLDMTGSTTAQFTHQFIGALDRAYFARFWMRFSDVTPAATSLLATWRATGGQKCDVRLETDGTITLRNASNTQVGSASAALSNDTWYCIQVKVMVPTAGLGIGELYLDEVLVAASSSFDCDNTAVNNLYLTNVVSAEHIYLDDVAINDDQGASQNGYPPAEGKIVLLKAVSDSAVGTGWTQPKTTGDDTTDLFASVDNTPPLGVAHSDADANNLFYVFNDDSLGAASSYDANCQTYTAAGIGASDTITLAQALVRLSTASTTGTNNMEIQLVSNPADAGATTCNAELTAVAGTEPSGWKSHRGALVYAPSPTLGTSPVVRVTKTLTGAARAHMADLMGVVVEYVPSSGTPHTTDPADTVALTDAVAKAQGLGRTDTLALADLFARTTVTARSVPDTVSLSDSLTTAKVIPLAINDTLSLADNAAPAAAKVKAQDDSVALTDAVAMGRGLAVSDPVALVDARAHTRGLVQADPLALADLAVPDLDTGGTDYELPVDDTVTLTDAQAKARGLAVTDSLALTDSAARAKVIPKAVDDTLTLADARAHARGLTQADSVTLSDSATPNLFVGGTDHTRQVDDTVALSDARAFSRGITRTEALSLADNFTRLAAYQRTSADAVVLDDLLARVHAASRDFADAVTLTDLISPEVPGEVDLDDIVLLTDEFDYMLLRGEIQTGHIDYALAGAVDELEVGRIAGGANARITEAEGGMIAR